MSRYNKNNLMQYPVVEAVLAGSAAPLRAVSCMLHKPPYSDSLMKAKLNTYVKYIQDYRTYAVINHSPQ